jgi:hypothetical protein
MNQRRKTPKSVWAEVREAYVRGDGSLRELSQQFKIPVRSVERHCSKEQWRQTGVELAAVAANSAVEAAREQGRKAGLDAAALIERTLNEAQFFLDKVQNLAAQEPLSSEELLKLCNAWRLAVTEGRRALGLDREVNAQQGFLRLDVLSRALASDDEPVLLGCEVRLDQRSSSTLPVTSALS